MRTKGLGWLWGLAERRKLDAGGGWGGGGGGVAEEHGRWGPVVRPAARAVFCMGRIRDEEEEGLGDVGSSSNRLKWSTDPNADMPLYSVPSSYLLSTAPESIKLNNVPLIIPNLLLKYESDMMLILLKQVTFNWSANVPTLLSKKHVHHI